MLDPLIAAKLNEAGFPFETDENRQIIYPTLSKLIEECGPNFGSIESVNSTITALEDGKRFVSRKVALEEGKWPYVYIVQSTFARTPDDSVALLWLHLNEK